MKTFFTGLILFLMNLTAFECGAQTSRLPKEMPANVEIGFHESAGMIHAFTKIGIANLTLSVEEKKPDDREARKWSARIERSEQEELYKLFVENRFDTIKNDERKDIVYDAGSEGISLLIGPGASYGISYGPNSPLSGDRQKRYQRLADAIKNLRARYENKSKTSAAADPAVFPFDAKEHFWIFKSGTPAALSDTELADIKTIIGQAVGNYNANRKTAAEIIRIDDGYKFQLVPVTTETGEKQVWANAFCREFGTDWKTQLVLVDDGGKCFFNLYINLTRNAYERFSVNGIA